jgi:hypothetical protein
MKRLTTLLLFLLCTFAWAQDEEERVYVSSCSLFVKATVYTPDSSDIAGKAMVEATLCDKNGIPIPGQKIAMTATCGILTCLQTETGSWADSSRQSPEHSCFVTGHDGKVLVFLVDIPFNRPGKVKTSCTYGDFKVQASAGFSVTRKVTRKKRPA